MKEKNKLSVWEVWSFHWWFVREIDTTSKTGEKEHNWDLKRGYLPLYTPSTSSPLPPLDSDVSSDTSWYRLQLSFVGDCKEVTKRLGTKNKGISWDKGLCGGRLKKRTLWMCACKCAHVWEEKPLQWESGNLFSVKGPHQQCTQERLTQWKRERKLDGVSQPRQKKENIVSFPSPSRFFPSHFLSPF